MSAEVAGLPVQIWQATIAGAVVALGWIVNGWGNRRASARLRHERQRDILTALRAEIQHYLDALALFDLDRAWSDVVQRMEQDATYHPLIPTETNDRVFSALIADVPLLPHDTVAPIARYYNQLSAIDAMISDLRKEVGGKTTQQRRIEMYTDYISLKKTALDVGRSAVGRIDSALGNKARSQKPGTSKHQKSEKTAQSGDVNTPDAALSDRKSEREI